MMHFPKLFMALSVLATSADAFVQTNAFGTGAGRRSTTSTLNMVAENAKVVLVTGSSRGLGKAIALEIGAQGQKMIINYVSDSSKEQADATVEEIKAAGGDAVAIQADSELVS
jgi:hypothetical protein